MRGREGWREREEWEEGASRRMMVLLEKQVHLQKEVGAGCEMEG